MDDMVRKLALEQRRRLVGRILGKLEGTVYEHLTRDEQQEIRQEVLDAVGAYHDFILDVLKVGREDMVRSDEALRLIRSVHEGQRLLLRAHANGSG